jgi:16S rRNA G966 N2-methylase RsmD
MSLESKSQRVRRILRMLSTGDVSPLIFAVWLRWHRLEFGFADEVSLEDGNSHQHSGGPALEKVLRALRVPEGSIALDLGVGTGIAAITLSRHFHRVLGVELSPKLVAAARRNLSRVSVKNVEIFCVDARAFDHGLDEVTHVYMFNPFPASVMAEVLLTLKKSLLRNPRKLTIIYKHPACHSTILDLGFLHVRDIQIPSSHPFAVYRSW